MLTKALQAKPFTCSPYSDKEVWNDTDANKTCDEWIDICLNKYH